jgi:hypothetical protein
MAEFQRGDMVYVRMVGGPLLTVESVWENPNNEYEMAHLPSFAIGQE